MDFVLRTSACALLVCASAAHAQEARPDANLGRNLAATCANCHGTNGQTRGNTVTALAGLPAERIVASFSAYKTGALPATIMHQIAKGYSDEQVKAIAAFFASQPAKR